jgi:tetratricopeptide (TPR) repeat protein
MPAWETLTDSLYNTDSAVTTHFRNLSVEWGYTVHAPEQFVNSLGYAFLQKKQFEKSYRFFNMNVKNYPDSFNVYDSMGDYYAAIGNKLKAKEYFEKALSIRDNQGTREKLKKIMAS